MADDVVFDLQDYRSHTVLGVSGYLDVSTSPRLREKLHEVADGPAPVVLLDLGSIEFVDSSALGVILNGWKLLNSTERTLAVVSPQARITKIFEITALNLSIPLFASIDEARAELSL